MGQHAEDLIDGFVCSHCGVYFEQAHGYPVLCRDCYKDETPKERAGIPKATNNELGKP